MNGDWVELCCAVTASPDHDGDCLCLLDQGHDEPHECATRSCRRQWVSKHLNIPARRTA